MDRDEALTLAIQQAKQYRTLRVIVRIVDTGLWKVYGYPEPLTQNNLSTRYILPNGEVTKLS